MGSYLFPKERRVRGIDTILSADTLQNQMMSIFKCSDSGHYSFKYVLEVEHILLIV